MKKLKEIQLLKYFGLFLITAFLVTGCSDSPVSPAIDNLEVSSFTTASADNSNGGDVIVITSAKVLIKDIKLNVAGSGENNFKTGPFVISLSLNSLVNQITVGMIPAGTYDKIKFEIHKPDNNEAIPDPEFRDSLGNYSVIAKGTFNGVGFTYKSTKSATQFLDMSTQIALLESVKSNVTLSVNPYSWFLVGGVYVDPSIASNENDIDNNIKESFRAIKDDDKNGIPD